MKFSETLESGLGKKRGMLGVFSEGQLVGEVGISPANKCAFQLRIEGKLVKALSVLMRFLSIFIVQTLTTVYSKLASITPPVGPW